MKNFRVLAIAMALTLSLAMTIFAFGRFTTKTLAQTAAASCCSNADCCKDGACKMGGSCCGSSADACQMKKQQAAKADLAGVPVEDASQNRNNAQTSATDKKDCCAGGGGACCNGGSCCKSKAKTTASL